MPLIKSSEIKPLPYFLAMSPCNQAAAAAASGSSSPSPFVDLADDDVRAPDPTRRERLVDYSGSDSYLSSSLLHQAIHNDSFSGSSRRAFSWSDHPMDVDDDTNDTGGVGRARENVRVTS